MSARRVTTTTRVETTRGVFMISVAAELAEMHPQTLRQYEDRGLVTPKRTAGGTRLYSQEDVDRLRRIQSMTAELGLNLAGVERVLELEERAARMARRIDLLERRSARLEAELEAALKVRGAELVRYEPSETALVRLRTKPARP